MWWGAGCFRLSIVNTGKQEEAVGGCLLCCGGKREQGLGSLLGCCLLSGRLLSGRLFSRERFALALTYRRGRLLPSSAGLVSEG